MNKILLPIGVLAIAVVAVGIYFATSGGKTTNEGQNQGQINSQVTKAVNPSGEYSINELLAMNKPMKCTWKEGVTNGAVTNIVYINGKKFYQDVTMDDRGHSYAISDGKYLYIWNDFTEIASKMKLSEMETGAKSGQTQNSAKMDQERDFVCENWIADNAIFNPPQDKNFKDVTEEMGQAMEELQENSEEYKQQACDMCRQAPTQELIDECLKNAQCGQ